MATLDFKELNGEPEGENFQALVRLLAERCRLTVQWAGRGPDGGRDLILIERQEGPLKSSHIRWLVSCKDNCISNKSVTERDAGSILDKVRQHQCQGFLLATTTTASSGLKELLDNLDVAAGGPIHTNVWDRFELTKMLLREEFSDVYLQFFPKQRAKEAVLKLDAAREVIESSVPRFVSGMIRERLVSFNDRISLLSGESVWPNDKAQSKIIDALSRSIVYRSEIPAAVERVEELEFDALLAFIDRLIRNFPDTAKRFLRAVGQGTADNGIIFNVIEILRECDDFGLDEELEITKKCDPETLSDLYREMTLDNLEDVAIWNWRLPSEVEAFADKVEVVSAKLSDLEFSGGEAVNLVAQLVLEIVGHDADPEVPSSRDKFSYSIQGYWLYDGIEIERVN